MTQQDLLVTPIWFIILSVAAYLIRPYVTDSNTRKYFMPAMLIRFVAAILLGVLYQFYYGGGDTLNYHTHGSVHIYHALIESPLVGLKMLFNTGEYFAGSYEYASHIWYYRDHNSYFIVKIAAFFDLFTFGTYSATALFFAAFSFSGLWALYQVFYNQYKKLHMHLALAILFIPSVVFWGSGILKDTITLGALGWMTWFFYKTFISRQNIMLNGIGLLLSAGVIYFIKVYIILSILPALVIWFVARNFIKIRSLFLKILIVPVICIFGIIFIYLVSDAVARDNPRYSLNNLAKTAQITAYDIRYGWGARDGEGAGYDLGVLDGTWQSMIKLAPAAVNVTLFRPYIWEIKNPLMILASFEALLVLILTLYVLFKNGVLRIFGSISNFNIMFCLFFAVLFAFAVGISTYNFGTLMRYKIPLMPYYLTGLVLLFHSNRERKISSLA